MKENRNRIEFIDLIMLVVLVIFTVLGNSNPMFSIALVATVIPMIIIGVNSNWAFKFFALILTTVITFVIYGKAISIETFFIYLLPAFLSAIVFYNEAFRDSQNRKIRLAFEKDSGVYSYASLRVFMISIILFMLGTIAYYASMKYFMNVDVVGILQDRIKDIIENYRTIVKSTELKNIYSSEIFDELLGSTGTIIMLSVFTRSLILALISYFFAIPVLNRFCKKKLFNIKFDCIILPGNPVLMLVVTIIVLYLAKLSLPDMDIGIVINNFMFVMNILFFIEGLSLIVFGIKRWGNIKKNINWILMAFLILFVGIISGIAVLGILDNIWNYRMKWDPGLKNFGGKNE